MLGDSSMEKDGNIIRFCFGRDKKVIPSLIEEYITPLALYVWIMDDGCKLKNKGMKFSTRLKFNF